MTRKKKSYQKGSIRLVKTKNGTVFQIRYRIRKSDGGWKQVTETLRGCPSKKAAQKVLDERLRKINGSNGGMTRSLKTMSDLLNSTWPNYLDNRNVKDSTKDPWHSITELYISPFFGNRILDDIDSEDVSNFMSDLYSRGLSSRYRLNIYQALHLMFEIAQLNRDIKSNPVIPRIHRPKVVKKKKKAWSIEQVKDLLLAVKPKYRVPLLVLALSGVRIGELLAIKWKNVDFFRKRIVIDNNLYRNKLGTTKTETSEREVGIPQWLSHILLEHRKSSNFTGPEDFVFCRENGLPMDPGTLRKQGIYPALKAAGIPYVKRESGCHAFRHYAGSVIHKLTGSLKMAQGQLGHSDLSTTGNIYVHTDEEQVDQSAEILGNVLGDICGRFVVETVSEKGSIQ